VYAGWHRKLFNKSYHTKIINNKMLNGSEMLAFVICIMIHKFTVNLIYYHEIFNKITYK